MHEILLTFRIRASLSGIEQTAQFGVARIILILTDLKFSAQAGYNMQQTPPRFWRSLVPPNRLLIESYCLQCSRYIAASRSEFNLCLMEMAHRATCKVQRGSEDKKRMSGRKQQQP